MVREGLYNMKQLSALNQLFLLRYSSELEFSIWTFLRIFSILSIPTLRYSLLSVKVNLKKPGMTEW